MNQTWWNTNLTNPEMMKTFEGWIGDQNSMSKIFIRNYVKSKDYKSLVDVGCGIATEYDGYKNDNYDIKYTGVDSCTILVEKNKTRGVPMIESNCESIPVEDNTYEVAFSRHVFEHQPHFEGTLKEMIRIGSKEAIHVFFIIPDEKEKIDYNIETNLYHNKYSKSDIESFLKQDSKVKNFEWKHINQQECSLHVYLN